MELVKVINLDNKITLKMESFNKNVFFYFNNKKKVVLKFTFNNEFDLLELRPRELYDHVDYFRSLVLLNFLVLILLNFVIKLILVPDNLLIKN